MVKERFQPKNSIRIEDTPAIGGGKLWIVKLSKDNRIHQDFVDTKKEAVKIAKTSAQRHRIKDCKENLRGGGQRNIKGCGVRK